MRDYNFVMRTYRMFFAAAIVSLCVAGPRTLAQTPAAPPAAAPPATSAAGATGPATAPFWTGMSSAAGFQRAMDGRLAHARGLLERLVAAKGPRTIDNTLHPFDDIQLELDAVAQQAQLIQSVHPDTTTREVAEKVSQRASALNTEVSLNRGVYDAITALDVSRADPETKYYVTRLLRDFRLAGVDKDETTRKRIQALRDELTELGQAF